MRSAASSSPASRAAGSTSWTSGDLTSPAERAVEVLDQIVRGLDAHGEADQAVGDAEPAPVFGIDAGMAAERRPRDQALDAPEADRLAGDLRPLDEADRGLLSSIELEAQHAAATGKQLAGPRVARMARESRIIDLGHPGSRLEKARDPQGALVLMAHPQGERLHPPMEQETGVRIERAAEVVELMADPLDEIRAADDRARHDV